MTDHHEAKLSKAMIDTLSAIASAGGEAHPEQGGWWRSARAPGGDRYAIPHGKYPDTKSAVGTTTVRALESRGLLEKIPNQGNHIHSAYRLTQAAREVLARNRST